MSKERINGNGHKLVLDMAEDPLRKRQLIVVLAAMVKAAQLSNEGTKDKGSDKVPLHLT